MSDTFKLIIFVIIFVILITIYVYFFIGMHKVFSMDEFATNTKLKCLLVAFTIIFIMAWYLMIRSDLNTPFLSLILLILVWFIYFEVKNSSLKNYFLPIVILYTILAIIFIIVILIGIYYPSIIDKLLGKMQN